MGGDGYATGNIKCIKKSLVWILGGVELKTSLPLRLRHWFVCARNVHWAWCSNLLLFGRSMNSFIDVTFSWTNSVEWGNLDGTTFYGKDVTIKAVQKAMSGNSVSEKLTQECAVQVDSPSLSMNSCDISLANKVFDCPTTRRHLLELQLGPEQNVALHSKGVTWR